MNRPTRGFTLVEVIIVLILLGILAVTVAPRFDRSAFDARGYFDRLLSAARYAQKLAVASNCEVRLTITAGGFTLQRPAAAAQCGNPVAWQSVSLPAETPPYSAPPGIATSAATITFDAAGLASADSTITVGGSYSFQVHAATGYVERL